MPIVPPDATPKTFISLTTDSKSRIFLHSDVGAHGRPTLDQVTTISCDADDANRLTDALNHAARTGQTEQVDHVLGLLPDAVAQSCRRSLASCPPPASLTLDQDGFPLEQIGLVYFRDPDEVAEYMTSALTLGLQVIVTNQREDRNTEYVAALYSGDVEVPRASIGTWLKPEPELKLLALEHPNEEGLAKALSDGRWDTYACRAYWVWVPDDEEPNSASAEFVVECYHEMLDPTATYLDFQTATTDGSEYVSSLAPRNRFMLFMSLFNICADLDNLLHEWADDAESMVRDDMPRIVRTQSKGWWDQMRRSATRLLEAARTDDHPSLIPRTPAEEALIALATTGGYIEWADDMAQMLGTSVMFDSLPVDEDDGEYGEILPDLTGDADVEMLWMGSHDGVEDPEEETNRYLGMGDYRPSAWHQLFDRAVRDLGAEQGLT